MCQETEREETKKGRKDNLLGGASSDQGGVSLRYLASVRETTTHASAPAPCPPGRCYTDVSHARDYSVSVRSSDSISKRFK